MGISRKHFNAIAAVFKQQRERILATAMLADEEGAAHREINIQLHYLAIVMADEYAKLNSAFDHGRFMRACGYDG